VGQQIAQGAPAGRAPGHASAIEEPAPAVPCGAMSFPAVTSGWPRAPAMAQMRTPSTRPTSRSPSSEASVVDVRAEALASHARAVATVRLGGTEPSVRALSSRGRATTRIVRVRALRIYAGSREASLGTSLAARARCVGAPAMTVWRAWPSSCASTSARRRKSGMSNSPAAAMQGSPPSRRLPSSSPGARGSSRGDGLADVTRVVGDFAAVAPATRRFSNDRGDWINDRAHRAIGRFLWRICVEPCARRCSRNREECRSRGTRGWLPLAHEKGASGPPIRAERGSCADCRGAPAFGEAGLHT
jgi:hypothetical protein